MAHAWDTVELPTLCGQLPWGVVTDHPQLGDASLTSLQILIIYEDCVCAE
jgi:hypothetical protein